LPDQTSTSATGVPDAFVRKFDHDGNVVNLRDLRGGWVLLWWYPMADTPG
jgi:peroxiredoxin